MTRSPRTTIAIAIAACTIAAPQAIECAEPDSSDGDKQWVHLDNGVLRVGLLRSHGGAIGYLSKSGSERNVFNHYDHGRLVQQSYYGDADGSLWNDKEWRYNPVQGGDWQGTAAIVEAFEATDHGAYVKTTPRHWAAGTLLSECVMEQWLELKGPLLEVRYRFSYRGTATHRIRHQEMPAVFVDPSLDTLVTYSGDKPWTNAALVRRVPGWPNEKVRLDENWVAYVAADDRGDGVGIFVPGTSEGTCYRFQGGGGSNCSYVAPIRSFALEPDLVVDYRAWFTLGSAEEIRERFGKLRGELAERDR